MGNLNSTCSFVCFFKRDQHLISLAIHIDNMGPLATYTTNGPVSTRRLLILNGLPLWKPLRVVFFPFDNSNVLSTCYLNGTSSTKEKPKERIS